MLSRALGRRLLVTPPVVGIDLGTTNLAVAVFSGGAPRILENAAGRRTTPSVVALTPSGPLVGTPAVQQAAVNPRGTFFGTKRLMGRKYDDVGVDRASVLYTVAPDPTSGDACVVAPDGSLHTPSAIGAHILGEMKQIAEKDLSQTVHQAVVTVPAYFNDAQRQATRAAGTAAGLEVLRVVNEPTAAALAYGLGRADSDGVVAVYDLGGGTFDVLVLDIEGGVFEVRATNGDTRLGGRDLDNAVSTMLTASFEEAHGPLTDRAALARIQAAAEQAKIDLDRMDEVEVELPFLVGKAHLRTTVTKAHLAHLAQPLVDRTVEPVKRCLKDAGVRAKDIDQVVLVGGMTRMPLVQAAVANMFQQTPSSDVNPDEAVALGAAIQGGILAGQVKDVLLLDVNPLLLGIETYGGLFARLIPRNLPVPTEAAEVFLTAVDGQSGVVVRVYQGERDVVAHNKLIGQFELTGIPPLPAGEPQIEVVFRIDADGITTVLASDRGSGSRSLIAVLATSGLSEQDVKQMVESLKDAARDDAATAERLKRANKADMVWLDVTTTLRAVGREPAPELAEALAALKLSVDALRAGTDAADCEALAQRVRTLAVTALRAS